MEQVGFQGKFGKAWVVLGSFPLKSWLNVLSGILRLIFIDPSFWHWWKRCWKRSWKTLEAPQNLNMFISLPGVSLLFKYLHHGCAMKKALVMMIIQGWDLTSLRATAELPQQITENRWHHVMSKRDVKRYATKNNNKNFQKSKKHICNKKCNKSNRNIPGLEGKELLNKHSCWGLHSSRTPDRKHQESLILFCSRFDFSTTKLFIFDDFLWSFDHHHQF